MIVVLHSSCAAFCTTGIKPLFTIINTICDSAVPLYFLLSAYLFYRNVDNDSLLSKMKKRVRTLVIPYLLWGILMYIYYCFIAKIPGIGTFFSSSFDFSVSSLPMNILLASCSQVMWFVRCLIIYVIFAPIILLLLKRKYVIIVAIALLLVLNLAFSFGYSSPLFWAPLYLIGAFLGKFYNRQIEEERFLNRISPRILIIMIIIWFAIVIIASWQGEYSKIYYCYRNMTPFFVYMISCYVPVLYRRPIRFSNYSFWVFCTHLQILQIVRKIGMVVLGKTSFALIVVFGITILATLVISISCGMLVKKILPRVYSVLTGKR